MTMNGGPLPEPLTVQIFMDEQALIQLVPDGTLTTNASGRLVGTFSTCSPTALAFNTFSGSLKPTPTFRFQYRTAFNGDAVVMSNPTYAFTGAINFGGPGSSLFVTKRPPPKVLLRNPIEDPITISSVIGPLGLDHTPPVRTKDSVFCTSYAGAMFPECYGDHEGTDYVLDGGFTAMDLLSNFIVAAADGVVTEVVDNQVDRCSGTLGGVTCPCPTGATTVTGGDGTQIACPYNPAGPNAPPMNHVTISHVIDQPNDQGFAITTRYFHIRKGSATALGIHRGQFVSCGQRIGRIGSSGRSTGPHLHLDVIHDVGGPFERTDPYMGRFSPQTYWMDQTGGVQFLPSSTCQQRSYSTSGFDATITASTSTTPASANATFNRPSGPVVWFNVVANVNLTGFNPLTDTVVWQLPRTAVTDMPQPLTGNVINFWIPLADARDPSLNEYSFNLSATVSQSAPVAASVFRTIRVDLPRPTVTIAEANPTTVDDGLCVHGPHYKIQLTPVPQGFSSAVSPTWSIVPSTGAAGTSTAPMLNLAVCSGTWADVSLKVVDAQGLLAATALQRYVAPTFVSTLSVS
ncbi:MAG: M23 family metallopeptidase, partial [Deltaproteobacteria bacterium]|nr:M23 family metallopeptidase [Deltaproteobacteria bacterium]